MNIGSKRKSMVIALGGNTLAPPSQIADVPAQFLRTRETMKVVATILQAGHHIVLTHGNGPQVGNILRRSEMAAKDLFPVPLQLCIADTQGAMGYMICVSIENELRSRGVTRQCVAFTTRVLVDPGHPEFATPTKPIGMIYPEAEAQRHMTNDGWKMVQIDSKGWRRVVPSPPPVEILEIDMIRRFVARGDLCVCGGGGGIPVYWKEPDQLHGVEAVVDKDRTAALLAAELNYDWLVIITGVPQVCTGFGKPDEHKLDRLTASEARKLLDAGEFPAGSMGPKMEAAIDFVTRSCKRDAKALITDDLALPEALHGRQGTWIARDDGNT